MVAVVPLPVPKSHLRRMVNTTQTSGQTYQTVQENRQRQVLVHYRDHLDQMVLSVTKLVAGGDSAGHREYVGDRRS
jgi:hypothetical protein